MSQVRVTLPDGMVLEMTEGSTIFDVASAIGPGLGKAAVAGQIDGVISSLSTTVLDGCSVRILTDRDDESLDVLRHSMSVRGGHLDFASDVGIAVQPVSSICLR